MHRKITRQSRWNLRRVSDRAIPNQAPGMVGEGVETGWRASLGDEGTVRLSSKGESDRITQRSAVQIRPPQPNTGMSERMKVGTLLRQRNGSVRFEDDFGQRPQPHSLTTPTPYRVPARFIQLTLASKQRDFRWRTRRSCNREISTGYLQLKISGVTRLIADYEASGTEGSAGFPHHRRRTAFCDRI